jgi:UDP-N-acetylglucosamine 3-dehydrogenase
MFNVCVVGSGDMGSGHANAWKKRSDARVVAVCDVDKARSEKLAAAVGATAYPDLKSVPRDANIQIVSVTTPVCFHSDVACEAARRGCHVLVEKPMALTLEQADAMIRTAKENNVQLSVSFQYRAFSRYVKYRELFRSGEFGGPVFFRTTDVREVRPKLAMHSQSMNGGPLIDMIGHFFDLMRYFTGQEPIQVYAHGHVFGRGKARLSGIKDLAIDAANIQVAFGGGHELSIFVDWGMPEGFPGGIGEEYLVGPNISARPVAGGVELRRAGGKTEVWTPGPQPEGPAARIDGLIKAIQGEAPLEVSGQDGRVALQLSLAALESIRTGKVIAV